ncbi:MAG: TIGR01777 family oxidoreductase [Bacteroidales bacterium]|nr:TIGR01777 family oxidoreductase [Bacteroidales bacterium]
MKRKTVLITGGTGLVGRALIPLLINSGYRVRILTRGKSSIDGTESFKWDIKNGYIEDGAVEGVDHIIHLAGENIGKGRWTKSRKKVIFHSRIDSARLLFDTVEKRNPKLNSFTSASATGYYGALTSGYIFSEKDPPAEDFTARVCIKWEEAAGLFRSGGYRTTLVRTGIVLSQKGGLLSKILPAVNIRFLPLFGKGNHYLPWIHIDDLCFIYLKIIDDNNIDGVFNAVAPGPVDYRTFIKTLSAVKNKKILIPPTPVLPWKIIFGEKASMLLEGSRVSADKIMSAGYEFRYPDLKPALENLLKKS